MQLHFPPAIAGIVLAALSSACAAVPSTADAPALEGTSWVLIALAGRSPAGGATITLRLEEGRAGGTDGCNRYTRPYAQRGSVLTFGSGGASTQMACAPDVMQQAAEFAAGLDSVRSHRLEGGQLQLLGADGALLATLAPQPQDLADTSWRVTGYNDGQQAVVSVLPGTTLTMKFAADGRVSGSAGCIQYSATCTLAGDSLRLGPAATTRRLCAEPGRILEQEQQYLKALESIGRARRDGDRLELRTADGALAATLIRDSGR